MLWFWIFSKEKNAKKIKVVLGTLIVSAIVVLPWNIRNYIVFRNPFMFTTNSAECLWYGNMPGSSGSLYAERGVTLIEKAKSQLPSDFFKMKEVEQASYLRKLTAGYFSADPMGYIGRVLKKAYYFWYFSPNQGSLYPALWMKMYKGYYIIMLLLALFSICYNLVYFKRKEIAGILLVWLLFFSVTCVHSLYYVEARHRWAIEALILIFSANAVNIAVNRYHAVRAFRNR